MMDDKWRRYSLLIWPWIYQVDGYTLDAHYNLYWHKSQGLTDYIINGSVLIDVSSIAVDADGLSLPYRKERSLTIPSEMW